MTIPEDLPSGERQMEWRRDEKGGVACVSHRFCCAGHHGQLTAAGARLLPFICSPHRLAWPRTSPFQGENTGSNPVGDAILRDLRPFPS